MLSIAYSRSLRNLAFCYFLVEKLSNAVILKLVINPCVSDLESLEWEPGTLCVTGSLVMLMLLGEGHTLRTAAPVPTPSQQSLHSLFLTQRVLCEVGPGDRSLALAQAPVSSAVAFSLVVEQS